MSRRLLSMDPAVSPCGRRIRYKEWCGANSTVYIFLPHIESKMEHQSLLLIRVNIKSVSTRCSPGVLLLASAALSVTACDPGPVEYPGVFILNDGTSAAQVSWCDDWHCKDHFKPVSISRGNAGRMETSGLENIFKAKFADGSVEYLCVVDGDPDAHEYTYPISAAWKSVVDACKYPAVHLASSSSASASGT